jgi:flavin-dependent dehydrogenase
MKIAIIEASIAGLLASYALAKRGVEVKIFTAEDGTQPASRTLIVTDKINELLGDEVGLSIDSLILNKIRQFVLLAEGKAEEILLKRPDYVIDRAMVINELRSKAEEAGVKIEEGKRFKKFLWADRENKLNFLLEDVRNKEEIVEFADIVIGADGAVSRVAMSAGWPKPKLLYLIQAVCPLPDDCASDTSKIWFIPELTPYFFWLIPESKDRCVVGLIGENKKKTQNALSLFLEKIKLLPYDFQDGWVPYSRFWIPVRKRLPGGEVYLVGDAACHVKLTTVGGFVTGVKGALGVVEAIFNSGRSWCLAKLRLELAAHRLVRTILNRFSERDYSRLISFLNNPTKEVLSRISRDEPFSLLLHLSLRAHTLSFSVPLHFYAAP